MTGTVIDRAARIVQHGSVLGASRMPAGPRWGRASVVTAAALALMLVTGGVIAFFSGQGGGTRSPHTNSTMLQSGSAVPVPSANGSLTWHTPDTITPAGTPVQEEYDQAFTQGLGEQPGMKAATSLVMPEPAVKGGWPALPAVNTPEGWAQEFAAGLLDVDYSHQSRAALGEWLQANEAPEIIPGVTQSVADKVLYISLLDPGLFGGQPTPIVTPDRWSANARANVSQSVSGLLVQPDPAWSQMIGAGWQPTDVRMTEEDVSGVLTIRQGTTVMAHRFALQLIVGSGRWRAGYGSVAVSGWSAD